MSNMIEIEIDGKKLEAQPNAMVIQVADAAGIYIPRFCYHKHLTVAANCRMCLVEVEKSPKALPACATPVTPGMKVFTRSAKAIAAQKAVMEFLLLNHPLDCPICDQGGECELQDLSMGYGSGKSAYVEGKRSVYDQDIGPLISTDMTRCIQCTRCVRYGDEIAGFPELGAVGRGEDMEISTYVKHAMHSEVSGNIIDLCPVGALTSKPYRFTARPWELNQSHSISPHDCLGSNLHVHTRDGRVMRIVPKENEKINLTWLSDRDRFSYEGLYHKDRLSRPLIRQNGKLQETDWQTVLEFAADSLQKIKNGDHIGALASPHSTVEEFYLLQKLMRQLGSNHIDHRLRQIDFADQDDMPESPLLNFALPDLDVMEGVLLVGSNIQSEQPLAALRLRKSSLKGAKIAAINMVDYDFHFRVSEKIIVAPQDFVASLKKLDPIVEKFKSLNKKCILLGAQAFNHPQASSIRAWAKKTGLPIGYLTEGSNSAGAWLAGTIPHRGPFAEKITKAGLNAQAMLRNPRQAYILLNVEPEYDFANSALATQALEQAQCIIALSTFRNRVLEEHATVILPASPFTETAGTFVNVTGEWQSFRGVAQPFDESRPAWKIIRVLAELLDCKKMVYESVDQVLGEIQSLPTHFHSLEITSQPIQVPSMEPGLRRIGEIPIYRGDSIVRRAKSLQATQLILEKNIHTARLHPATAKQLGLKEGMHATVKQQETRLQLPVVFDERVPENAVYIAGGIAAAVGLGELFGVVEITP